MSEVELDEDALFEGAVSDETTDTPVVTEPEKVEQPEPEQTEAAAETEVEPDKVVADDKTGRVPAFRLREEADARRQLETDLANERADKAALRQRLEALERPAPKVEPTTPAKPDPLLDPDGYDAYIEAKVEAKLLNNHRETDLRLTRQSNAEIFDKAYGESQRLKESRDPAFLELADKMQKTNAPGKVLLDWYQDRTTKAEIGSDLNAYKARLREEALKDPEFRKAAMEAWRTDAQPQTNGRPRIDLPPTLNGASRSSAVLSATADVGEDELFDQITG